MCCHGRMVQKGKKKRGDKPLPKPFEQQLFSTQIKMQQCKIDTTTLVFIFYSIQRWQNVSISIHFEKFFYFLSLPHSRGIYQLLFPTGWHKRATQVRKRVCRGVWKARASVRQWTSVLAAIRTRRKSSLVFLVDRLIRVMFSLHSVSWLSTRYNQS